MAFLFPVLHSFSEVGDIANHYHSYNALLFFTTVILPYFDSLLCFLFCLLHCLLFIFYHLSVSVPYSSYLRYLSYIPKLVGDLVDFPNLNSSTITYIQMTPNSLFWVLTFSLTLFLSPFPSFIKLSTAFPMVS